MQLFTLIHSPERRPTIAFCGPVKLSRQMSSNHAREEKNDKQVHKHGLSIERTSGKPTCKRIASYPLALPCSGQASRRTLTWVLSETDNAFSVVSCTERFECQTTTARWTMRNFRLVEDRPSTSIQSQPRWIADPVGCLLSLLGRLLALLFAIPSRGTAQSRETLRRSGCDIRNAAPENATHSDIGRLTS